MFAFALFGAMVRQVVGWSRTLTLSKEGLFMFQRILALYCALALYVALAIPAAAQVHAGFLPVHQSGLVDSNGASISNATMCAKVTLNGQDATVQANGQATVSFATRCTVIVNGAWQLNLPDMSFSVPKYACLSLDATDNVSGNHLLTGYSCVQPRSVPPPNIGSTPFWCSNAGCDLGLLPPNYPASEAFVAPVGPQGTPGCLAGNPDCTTLVQVDAAASQVVKQSPGTSLNVNVLNGEWNAIAWCATPGVLDDTCIQRAIDDISIHGSVGASVGRQGKVYIPAGNYLIHHTLIVPVGTRVEIAGSKTSNWGSVLIEDPGVDILAVHADTVKIHGLLFRGDTSAGPVGHAIVLGTATQPTYDSYIEDNWFISNADSAIDIVNGSNIWITNNDFDQMANAAIYAHPASGASVNNVHISSDFWNQFGSSVDAAGLVGGSGSNVYALSVVGSHFRLQGLVSNTPSMQPDQAGLSLSNVYGVTVSGNQFVLNSNNDILFQNVQGATITGNSAIGTGREFIDCRDCQGVVVSGNTGTAANASGFTGSTVLGWISFRQISGMSAGNTASSNTLTSMSGQKAAWGIYSDANTSSSSVFGNQVAGATGAVFNGNTSNQTRSSVKQVFVSEAGGTVASFGQVDTPNPKKLDIIGDPANNNIIIEASQAGGGGYNQTLSINPNGGTVIMSPAMKINGMSPGAANHAACWKSNNTPGYCSSAVAGDGSCTCN
jgi:hypothetical protein